MWPAILPHLLLHPHSLQDSWGWGGTLGHLCTLPCTQAWTLHADHPSCGPAAFAQPWPAGNTSQKHQVRVDMAEETQPHGENTRSRSRKKRAGEAGLRPQAHRLICTVTPAPTAPVCTQVQAMPVFKTEVHSERAVAVLVVGEEGGWPLQRCDRHARGRVCVVCSVS
jgi:hypothetical protein